MGGMTTGRTRRAITVVTIALVGTAALAGCTDDRATPAASGSSSSTAAGGTTPSARSSATATPAPVGSPVDVACDVLVPQSVLTAYGQTFTLEPDATPRKNSPAADIAAQRGDVCTWQNDSGDVTITLAVADLPDAPLTKLKDSLFEDSNSVPTYTVEGYFDTVGDVGRADAFVDPYWVNVESTMFTEPGTVQPIVDSVRSALAGSASPSAAATTAP
jgi:hypothetical protein